MRLPISALATFLILIAALFAYTTLVTVLSFGLNYPAFDQFRLYPIYIGMEFPVSAVQLENGHRPVLPSLIRIAEIHWRNADQSLQMVFGLASIAIAIVAIGFACWRDCRDAVNGAVAWLLTVLGLLWLGNARMLIHANEIVHTYMVVAFFVMSLYAVYAASRRRPILWMTLAGAALLCATFSFGPGMAAFAAVLVVAAVARVQWRAQAIPAMLLGLSGLLYLSGMPGDAGVRGSLFFEPVQSASAGLRWLSAPWMHSWFGMAHPPLFPWLDHASHTPYVGAVLAATAGVISASVPGPPYIGTELAIGTLGAIGWIGCIVAAWRNSSLTRSEIIALGLSTFGLCVGAIIVLARLDHFRTYPTDLLAERYLPWSCLFWLGLALYPVVSSTASSNTRRGVFMASAALLAAIVLYPTQRTWAAWSASVHRSNQASAVAAQLGIWDPERFPDGLDARRLHVVETLALLRAHRLSMFAEPEFAFLTQGWKAAGPLPLPFSSAELSRGKTFLDEQGRSIDRFEGRLPAGLVKPSSVVLLAVDADGQLIGLAKFSFRDASALRLDRPEMRGFDGYVIGQAPNEPINLLLVDSLTREVIARLSSSSTQP